MIRGSQKKMIVVRTHDSRVFEEAYFVIRRDTEFPSGSSDMLLEADRIIRRNTVGQADESPHKKRRARLRAWIIYTLCFSIGAMLGVGATLLLQLPG